MGERRRVAVTGIGTVNAFTAGGTEAVAASLALGRSGDRPRAELPAPRQPEAVSPAQVEAGDARRAHRAGAAADGSRACASSPWRPASWRCGTRASPAGAGLGIVVGTEHGDFRSSEEFARGLSRSRPGRALAADLSEHRHEHHGVAGGDRGRGEGAIRDAQPADGGGRSGDRARGGAHRGGARGRRGGRRSGRDLRERVPAAGRDGRPVADAWRGGRRAAVRTTATHNGPVLGEGATFLVLEDLAGARRARRDDPGRGGGRAPGATVPAAPRTARRPTRADRDSPVCRLLLRTTTAGFTRCYGSGNGDPGDRRLGARAARARPRIPGLGSARPSPWRRSSASTRAWAPFARRGGPRRLARPRARARPRHRAGRVPDRARRRRQRTPSCRDRAIGGAADASRRPSLRGGGRATRPGRFA